MDVHVVIMVSPRGVYPITSRVAALFGEAFLHQEVEDNVRRAFIWWSIEGTFKLLGIVIGLTGGAALLHKLRMKLPCILNVAVVLATGTL